MSVERGEVELVGALRDGEPEALGELFDRHADRIYNHCFRLLGDWSEAEDATSTVFLEVWRHHRRVRPHDGSALPWLYGVATNVCRNRSRSRRRGTRAAARLAPPAVEPDHADRVSERLDSQAQMRALLSRVESLPDRERDVLALVVWSGLSYEAAAAALGIPVGTVRSRLSRARTRLADQAQDIHRPGGAEGAEP